MFAGDARMRRELGDLCSDADVACPFGCVDEQGGTVAFNLGHAALVCPHRPISVAREAWRACVRAKGPAMQASAKKGSTPHQQLSRVQDILSSTAGWRSGATQFASVIMS